MPTIASYLPLNVSETVGDRGLMTTNRKLPMRNRMVTWLMTSRDPERSNSWLIYYLENCWRCYL